jgi:inner membrane transporter RhtA
MLDGEGGIVNGSVLVIAAIVAQAVTNGVLSGHLDGSGSLLLSFTAFGISALAAGIVDRHRRTGRARRPLRGERLCAMALLNGATAVAFLGFYTALTLAPAPLAAAIETGIGPLAIGLGTLRHRETTSARRILIGALTLLLALGAALCSAATGPSHSAAHLTAGLALAAIAGSAAAGIAVLSHRLGKLGVSPVTVTAHRFHLTYLLALGLLLLNPSTALRSIASANGAFIALLAVFGVALPLFVLQIGMQRTPPIVVTLLASAVPGMTYLTAVCARSQGFDPLAFFLINGSLVLAFAGPIFIRSRSRQKNPTPSLQQA